MVNEKILYLLYTIMMTHHVSPFMTDLMKMQRPIRSEMITDDNEDTEVDLLIVNGLPYIETLPINENPNQSNPSSAEEQNHNENKVAVVYSVAKPGFPIMPPSGTELTVLQTENGRVVQVPKMSTANKNEFSNTHQKQTSPENRITPYKFDDDTTFLSEFPSQSNKPLIDKSKTYSIFDKTYSQLTSDTTATTSNPYEVYYKISSENDDPSKSTVQNSLEDLDIYLFILPAENYEEQTDILPEYDYRDILNRKCFFITSLSVIKHGTFGVSSLVCRHCCLVKTRTYACFDIRKGRCTIREIYE
ncbi:uncharacterized protein LOC119683730 [Teleopsis dalmanni]|uniref:uncharacterized protein LOC119683730 n=1 Tax=Teleopsis dalmanni TaxID=139649 RepID=UPI0018CDA097|nr:uncharacterized protein LOC119683730 [Teleopsis dalmanni]